ncbi:MAG: PA14 domain-containing protein [Armatimonadota bacterium]
MRVRTVLVLLTALALLAGCIAANAAVDAVVFRDTNYPLSWIGATIADDVTSYLESKGFKVVDAEGLKAFCQKHVSDRATSVVVMANDIIPDTVAEPLAGNAANPSSLFRRYLENGGKVIYISDWPMYYVGFGDGTRQEWGEGGAVTELGFYASRWGAGVTDINQPVVFTEEGKKWGLTKPWISARATQVSAVDVVLGNPTGNISAAMPYVKYFVVGRPGSGFVYMYDKPGGDLLTGGFDEEDLEQIYKVATYFPAGEVQLTTVLSGVVNGKTGPAANTRIAFTDSYSRYVVTTDAEGRFSVVAAKGKYNVSMAYLGTWLPLGELEVTGEATQQVTLGIDPNDTTPPGRVTDLTVASATQDSVTLTWTGTQDAFLYEIRYGLGLINESTWNSLALVTVLATGPAGTKESVTISGLSVLQKYNFAIRAVDTNLNASAISTVVGETTGGQFGDGLKGEYYQWDTAGGSAREVVFDKANLLLTRYDAPINFAWGGNAPAPGLPADRFAVRWTGYVIAPTSEDYTFYAVGDDGVVLWVSDSPIDPDNPGDPVTDWSGWKDQGETEYASQPITLQKGKKYYILFEYYENGGDATARLRWSSPTIEKQPVPAVYLYSGTVASSGRITGVVLDANGAPLSGVPVTITGPRGVSLTTAVDGSFSALLPEGSYTVSAALANDDLLKGYNASTNVTVQGNTITPVTLTINVTLVSMSLRAADLKAAGKPGWRFLSTLPDDVSVFEGMSPNYSDYISPTYKDTGADKNIPTSTWIEDWKYVPGDAGPDGRAGLPGGIPDNTYWVQRLHFVLPAEMEKAEAFVLRDFNMDDINEITAVNGTKIGGEPGVWQWNRNWFIPFKKDVVLFGGKENVLAMVGYEGGGGAGHNLDLGGPTLIAIVPGAVAPPPPAVVKGDVNGDGKVGIPDATIALQIAVGIVKPTDAQLAGGDLNGNGRIEIAEVTQILRAAVGLAKLG